MTQASDRSAQRIQELDALLLQPGPLQAQIDMRVELAWETRMRQPERAAALGRQAVELSRSGEFKAAQYAPGVAGGLICQAFVDTYAGDLGAAIGKCQQALGLLDTASASAGRFRAYYTLGWAYFFLGDFPAALDNSLLALNLSHDRKDRLEEAWALDIIAACQGTFQDFDHSLPNFEAAMRIFTQFDDCDGQVRVGNNTGYALFVKRDHDRALETTRRALELARQVGLFMDFYNGCCTAAQILIDVDRLDEAEYYLREAVAGLQEDHWGIAHVSVLQEWSRLNLRRNEMLQAEDYLLRAVGLAKRLGRLDEQAACHRSLSVIYERQGQLDRALLQYKIFHELNEKVIGDQAARRLAVLQTKYEVETARRESELYRLRARELEQEIDDQKRAHDILEREAMLDPLTSLSNRRVFERILEQEILQARQNGQWLSLIMLDIDLFKAYNDTYGHVQGDECLQRVAMALAGGITRRDDLLVRYGGEEFICVLPATDMQGAQLVAERFRMSVVDMAIPHRASSVADHVTVSIGVISIRCSSGCQARDLIEQVDARLYAAKAAGRNRVHSEVISPDRGGSAS